MKLKEWAEKTGVKYLTAYRWFKSGTLPVKAYQTDSGTIIVEDPEFSESTMPANNHNDAMSTFLKKTVEFSSTNSSIEDFAAYIISNFSLKLNSAQESPKYSKNKPKPEDIQKHFQKFLKPKGEKPKPFIADPNTMEVLEKLSDGQDSLIEEIYEDVVQAQPVVSVNLDTSKDIQLLINDLSSAISTNLGSNNTTTYESLGGHMGVVSRNVDIIPQSINYTSSNNLPTNSQNIPSISNTFDMRLSDSPQSSAHITTGNFKLTQKEVEKVHEVLESAATELHTAAVKSKSRRGRKPFKK